MTFDTDAVRCKACGNSYLAPFDDADGTKLAKIVEHHLVGCMASRDAIGEHFRARYSRAKGEATMPELWFVHVPCIPEQRYMPHTTHDAAKQAAAEYARVRPGQRIYVFKAQWLESCETTNVVWRAEPVTP